jgi:Arm domain-containing DNA-binding protein
MKFHNLTDAQVEGAQPGRYGDGEGLALIVARSPVSGVSKKWVLRFQWNGRPTEMGLGGYGTTLEEAKVKAAKARGQVRNGINPIESKQAAARLARLKYSQTLRKDISLARIESDILRLESKISDLHAKAEALRITKPLGARLRQSAILRAILGAR